MANNFRIIGDRYYSKAGHDSNDGLTSDTPKKTFVAISGTTAVIGAGVYNSAITNTPITAIYGDGFVVFDFLNSVTTQYLRAPLYNVIVKNGILTTQTNSLKSNCTFSDITGSFNIGNGSVKNKIINCDCRFSSISTGNRLSSIFINTILTQNSSGSYCYDSYFNFTSTLVLLSGVSPLVLRNCNIQGIILLDGFYYAIQDQLTGTPQDNGYDTGVEWLTEANLTSNGYTGTISGWDTAIATCINREPKFNDASKLDFTLQADSPHIGRASDGVSNIGGTEYAQANYAGIANPNSLLLQGDENIDSTTNVNDWVLDEASTQGYIRSIYKVSDTNEELGEINYIGNYSFDSDEEGGTSSNFNVPDSKPVTNEYPDYVQTTSDGADVYQIVIANHSYVAGQWIKVEGQYREIDSVDTNTIYFTTAVRAIVLSGTDVQIGAFSSLADLNPNRLNYLMRTSTSDVNSGNWNDNATWDNNGLATAGEYLTQEWNNIPMIDNLNGVGFGDDNYDSAFGNAIQAKYIDMLIYLRDDYKS